MNRPAFTLLELLIVVAILGLLAAVASVRFHGPSERAQLRAATLEIETALRRAQQLAKTRDRAAWLELRRDPAGLRILGEEDLKAPWRALDRVLLSAAFVGNHTALEPFRIRITPAGAYLPWRAELSCGTARREVLADGLRWDLKLTDRPVGTRKEP